MTETKKKILVVDDEPAVCEVVKEFLESRGYRVVTALSGQEALAAVRRERPDLVLLDILMPGMNGLEVLQRIRQMDPSAGVIMLTAVKDEEVARQAMQQEAYDYLTKPVDLDYLELTIITKLARMAESIAGQPRSGAREPIVPDERG
jgi:CheY-like chemotaxis protein